MKRFTYIVLFLAGLAVVSCTKQEVVPAECGTDVSAPVWRSSEAGSDDSDGGIVIEGTAIVDPHDDEGSSDDGSGTDGNSIVDPRDDDNKGTKKGRP